MHSTNTKRGHIRFREIWLILYSVIDMFETDEIEAVKRDSVEGSAGGGESTSSVRLFDFSTSCIPYKIHDYTGCS